MSLVADDATVVGVADDALIPVVLGVTGVAALGVYLNNAIYGSSYVESFPSSVTWEWKPAKPTNKIVDETLPIAWTIPISIPKLKDAGIEFLYELKATVKGQYPIYKWGLKDPVGYKELNAGDTWKYGTSIDPEHRYTMSNLSNTGPSVVMVLMDAGGPTRILLAQKILIMSYTILHGQRPAGNKNNN